MTRTRRLTKGLAVLLGVGAGFVALCNALVLWEGSKGVFGRAEEVPSRAVALVLGARVYSDGTPSPVLEDRLAMALTLYRRGVVRKVLVTGDNGREDYDEVTNMRRWLVARGVPEGDVVRDHAGFRTWDSMVRAVKVFRVRHAVVCTQRFHMARSLYLARAAGLDAVGAVADLRPYHGRWRFAAREVFARTAAVLDARLLHRNPRFLGPVIPVE